MDSTKTSLTLLQALCDPTDSTAWERFDACYRPMILRFAGRLGLDQDGAEEVAQRTTVAVYKSVQQGRYDRTRGRFKDWLLGIARHVIADFLNERARQPISASQRTSIAHALSALGETESPSIIWEREWERHILTICLERADQQFSSRDMRIFKMLALQGLSVDSVTKEMGVSRGSVYLIKHRILKFIGEVKEDFERVG